MSIYSAKVTQQLTEFSIGLIVIIVFITGIIMAIVGHSHESDSGYLLKASFGRADGLGVGADVKLAGVDVGHVTHEQVNPTDYKAIVTFTVRSDISLPTDTAAIITSDSLLGGKYIDLSPGGNEETLRPNSFINHTQGSISLQELLTKFIFSVTDNISKNDVHNSKENHDSLTKSQ
ncbi:hypothetical protein COMNV_01400 [Commensalibacter sp. Nvir]|uniref:outer membrane lipid asymmetry maintenance protein MlaD n=1 Tax=Commensalibacter sp. Nvir TaxID=3069817 RepID=UPI002D75BF12|nr:hypothetical protein COMNV_01400 [Commensalibacter sp. Nvir]